MVLHYSVCWNLDVPPLPPCRLPASGKYTENLINHIDIRLICDTIFTVTVLTYCALYTYCIEIRASLSFFFASHSFQFLD